MAITEVDPTGLLDVSAARRWVRSGEARKIRELAGLTQSEIGRALNVSVAAVSRWEAGERVPRADVAIRYLKLLRALKAHR